MRVEAIVKKGGWFTPNPGFAVGSQKHILLDITPILDGEGEMKDDIFVQAAGILRESTQKK